MDKRTDHSYSHINRRFIIVIVIAFALVIVSSYSDSNDSADFYGPVADIQFVAMLESIENCEQGRMIQLNSI